MVALGRVALLLAFGAEARLRSASKARRTRSFDDLAECEVAYDQLHAKCSRAADHSEVHYKSADLASDERGDSYSHRETKIPYKSPDGWDHNQHGEDWDHLGQCGARGQSPIDLARYVDVRGQTKYVLWFDYYLDPDLQKNHRAKLVNDGHGVSYDVRPNGIDLGFLKIGETEYAASEYTFHAPSEHTLDGATFPLEMQIINQKRTQSTDHSIVAVSLLFREGKSNRFLAGLRTALNDNAPSWSVHGPGTTTLSGLIDDAFDLEALIPKGGVDVEHTFFNYEGSLTSPPCKPADWWVLSNPIEATREEIRFIRRAIFNSESTRHGNARATQPLDGRPVFAGLTGFQHAIKYHALPNWQDKDALQSPRGYTTEDMPWGDHWDTLGPGPAPGPASGPGAPGAMVAAAPGR